MAGSDGQTETNDHESTENAGSEEKSTDPTRVERSFTCTTCGFAMTQQVNQLQLAVQATCLNCGEWTTQLAESESVVAAARDVAEQLSGAILTERQALAYLLRDIVGMSRQTTAEVMETTPSNVDNLQRRGREKVRDARRLLDHLDAYQSDDGQ